MTPRYRLSRRQTVLVLLEVAGHRYGMGIAVVSDVHALHRVGATADWRIDDVPAPVRLPGRTLRLGDADMPLVDLRSRLGLPRVAASTRRLALVVIQSGGRKYGLLVDRVQDIVEVPSAAISPPHPGTPDGAFIEAEAIIDGEPIDLLAAEMLLLPLMAVTA